MANYQVGGKEWIANSSNLRSDESLLLGPRVYGTRYRTSWVSWELLRKQISSTINTEFAGT